MQDKYLKQVELLVRCLPIIQKEECFAIKGGTAINLFELNLPRLSVDIDLVYLPIEDRESTIENIHLALHRIAQQLKKIGIQVFSNGQQEEKLVCSDGISEIKIEPNYTLRGYLFKPRVLSLCPEAEKMFGYAEAKIIAHEELWGGKICAALDRQHPRDLFDIRNLFGSSGITEGIKKGFIQYLLSANRPVHEILNPNFQLSNEIFVLEFNGMSDIEFSFEDAKNVFQDLKIQIKDVFSEEDKNFLLDFVQLRADFLSYSIKGLDTLPGVKWKILNLQKLQIINKQKIEEQYNLLKKYFKNNN